MTTTYVHFACKEGSNHLTIFTARPEGTGVKTAIDLDQSWRGAMAARITMEEGIRQALAGDGTYPEAQGWAMERAVGWKDGLALILPEGPQTAQRLKVNLNYRTCWLIPELIPVREDRGRMVWLDQIGPVYRTLEHIERPSVKRPPIGTMAILHQDGPFFRMVAEQLQHDLQQQAGGQLRVDRYSGAQLQGDEETRYPIMLEIFSRHTCVVFIGHMDKSHGPSPGNRHGWVMSEDGRSVVTMEELKRFFSGRGPVPEIVFACCCHSASSDPEEKDQASLSYPKLFLDAGVRFYVGTWMDFVAPDETVASRFLLSFTGSFLRRWAGDSDKAIEHLYEAKQELGFPLAASLFQIYATSEEEATAGTGGAPGALVCALALHDRLGEYELIKEMWADLHARTFWARHADGTTHLVQVLTDELQNDSRIAAKLSAAVSRLQNAHLSPGHLVPLRYESLVLTGETRRPYPLHVLVYDCTGTEHPPDWHPLADQRLDPSDPTHCVRMLRIGERISRLLAELHRKGFAHGNLHCANVVLSGEEVLLKDAWVHHVQGEAASVGLGETGPGQTTKEQKRDCWALGIVLFQALTGRPPFAGNQEGLSPGPPSIGEFIGSMEMPQVEAVDSIIRECLVPAPELRSNAEAVAAHLALAQQADSTHLSEFQAILNQAIQAGHRLFYICGEDYDHLLELLRAMTKRNHRTLLPGAAEGATFRYRLYVAEEHRGLVDDERPGSPVIPWSGAQSAEWNAAVILMQLSEFSAGEEQFPIILIRGCDWWDFGFEAQRYLRICQSRPRGPAVIVTDDFVKLDAELARSFVIIPFPHPAPAVLFQRIRDFAKGREPHIPTLPDEVAVLLTTRLFPCYWRQAREALHLCALKYGVIDDRALLLRDEQREQEFRAIPGVSYTPVSRLPGPDHFGMAPELHRWTYSWAQTLNASLHLGAPTAVPRRIMIWGPSGCGKTSYAQTLAAFAGLPLLHIHVAQCVRGLLGSSERFLRTALEAAGELAGAVVLLDDIDRFFADRGAAAARRDGLAGTLTRMSSVILNWLDGLAPSIVAVMTAERFAALPDQWRRRFEHVLEFQEPVGTDPTSLQHRQAIFQALFRRFALAEVADDEQLIETLARKTHPSTGISRLMSPIARKSRKGCLASHIVFLRTGADIEEWMRETIFLHNGEGSPRASEFWYDALQIAP